MVRFSLQASIEAAWYSWAGPMFLLRAPKYFLWMACIISFDYVRNWVEIILIYPIIVGRVHFAKIEVASTANEGERFNIFLLLQFLESLADFYIDSCLGIQY